MSARDKSEGGEGRGGGNIRIYLHIYANKHLSTNRSHNVHYVILPEEYRRKVAERYDEEKKGRD